jgi:hypothetical protein
VLHATTSSPTANTDDTVLSVQTVTRPVALFAVAIVIGSLEPSAHTLNGMLNPVFTTSLFVSCFSSLTRRKCCGG